MQDVAPRRVSFGIVRDKHGKPRIDGDPENLRPQMKMMLTRSERQELGMWDGDYVLDSQGLKRITVSGDGEARCEDALVGAGDLSIDGAIIGRLNPRVDVPAGGTLRWRTA